MKRRLVSQAQYDQYARVLSAEILAASCYVSDDAKPSDTPAIKEHRLNYPVRGVPMISCSVRVRDLVYGQPAIYQIIERNTGQVIYVGQTICARHRFENHSQAVGNVMFEILETSELDELGDRLRLETYYIQQRLKEGEPLLNACHVVKEFKDTH